ncbi:MAG: hypothetical protein IPP40_06325 [bacterium]|nr:hypothetical protein [bacterium]
MSWRKLIIPSLALAVIVVGMLLNVNSSTNAISAANAREKICEKTESPLIHARQSGFGFQCSKPKW